MTDDVVDNPIVNLEPIEINDMHTFAHLLGQWHEERVAILEHMLLVPEGTEMVHDRQTIVLAGDTLIAFKAGVSLTLSELGTLPFASVTEEVKDEPKTN